ncbi:putative O-succinylbenzoate--CoA ligase [unidentified eubacterium SCB49]|nr:putative O-succinylbenzoate--CoA ligase [unidentified eubacterium SCB49]
MKHTRLHPSFAFNGTHFSEAELITFAKKLQIEGEDFEKVIGEFIVAWLSNTLTVTVKTSGSTGTPKDILLQKKQMLASAQATGAFFNLSEGTSALLCLPANYIAGKMMLVRAMVLGWDLHAVSPEKKALSQEDMNYDFAAMVPYQVFHSLDAIHKIKKLIVGGGAISSALRSQLQEVSTQVFETYGMTETITHIAVKCTNGAMRSSVFTALPNVSFVKDERDCLVIEACNISEEPVITNDIVSLISDTAFTWLGRYDNVINSGGVKLFPETIEAKLSEMIKVPFVIIGEKDEALGERVVIVFEGQALSDIDTDEAFKSLKPFERPKKSYTLLKFPQTETGKVKREEISRRLKKNSD